MIKKCLICKKSKSPKGVRILQELAPINRTETVNYNYYIICRGCFLKLNNSKKR